MEKRWLLAWDVGGKKDDELFAVPREMLSTRDGLYVLDVGTLELTAFDFRGTKRWTVGGKGGGPGQFQRPTDLTGAPNGDVAVFDPGNGRISYFTSSGVLRRTVPTGSIASTASSLCLTTDGRSHFWVARGPVSIQTIESNGRESVTRNFPWGVLPDASPFLKAANFARGEASTDCGFATLFGFGIGRFSNRDPMKIAHFIVDVPAPVLKQEKLRSGGVRINLESGNNASQAAFRVGDTMFVSMAVQPNESVQHLDLYTSRGYVETWSTVPSCERITYYSPWFYCLHNSQLAPEISAFIASADTVLLPKLFARDGPGRRR